MANAPNVLPSSKVSDPFYAAAEAMFKGEDMTNAVYGTGTDEAGDDSAPAESGANPLDSVQETGVADNSTSSSKEIESPLLKSVEESSSPSDSSIEKVFVKGPEGKRQSIEIDYNNRDAIKQAYLKAAGMRKFQQERDLTSTQLKKLENEFKETKATLDKLEDIYKNQGVKGIITQLGGEDAIKKLVDDELRHREYLGSLTPEEKYRYDLKSHQEQSAREKSVVEDKYKQMMVQLEQKEEQAATRSLESRLHPAFDRYRFAGKLGDAVAEHQLDETVWNQVTKRLAEYPEEVELTQAVIDREFRAVAQNLQKVINVQTEKRVQKTVDKKKNEAMKTAQMTAKKGLTNSGERDKFIDNIKNGNITGAIASMMQGKIRL